jgi:hypothetical protein
MINVGVCPQTRHGIVLSGQGQQLSTAIRAGQDCAAAVEQRANSAARASTDPRGCERADPCLLVAVDRQCPRPPCAPTQAGRANDHRGARSRRQRARPPHARPTVRPVTPQLGEDARRARALWRHACAALGGWSREATQQDGGPCVLIASVRTHCASTTSVQGLSRAAARFPSVHPQQCSHGGGSARSRPEPDRNGALDDTTCRGRRHPCGDANHEAAALSDPLAVSPAQPSGLVSGHVEGRTGVHRQAAHRGTHGG